jgi:hypothetical protein
MSSAEPDAALQALFDEGHEFEAVLADALGSHRLATEPSTSAA